MVEARDPSPDEQGTLDGAAGEAAASLGVSLDAPAKELVTAVNERLSAAESGEAEPLDGDGAVGMGALVGTQYVRGLGWSWVYATWEQGFEAWTVVSADRSLAINPLHWIRDIAAGEKTTNVLLNYNMIEAGNVPPVEPGSSISCSSSEMPTYGELSTSAPDEAIDDADGRA